MERINIGKIVKAVGIKGEVKVHTAAGSEGRYDEIEKVAVGETQYGIEKVRYQGNMVIIKLEGVDDRNEAEAMRGLELFIDEDDLPELPEDTFYIRDILGSTVYDGRDGKVAGCLKDVIGGRAQDVYVIESPEGEDIMVPAVKEFIRSIDLEEKKIIIDFIEGMR